MVKKVAVHSGGRHAMALTVDGKVSDFPGGDCYFFDDLLSVSS